MIVVKENWSHGCGESTRIPEPLAVLQEKVRA
jgi:hypothetical protein